MTRQVVSQRRVAILQPDGVLVIRRGVYRVIEVVVILRRRGNRVLNDCQLATQRLDATSVVNDQQTDNKQRDDEDHSSYQTSAAGGIVVARIWIAVGSGRFCRQIAIVPFEPVPALAAIDRVTDEILQGTVADVHALASVVPDRARLGAPGTRPPLAALTNAVVAATRRVVAAVTRLETVVPESVFGARDRAVVPDPTGEAVTGARLRVTVPDVATRAVHAAVDAPRVEIARAVAPWALPAAITDAVAGDVVTRRGVLAEWAVLRTVNTKFASRAWSVAVGSVPASWADAFTRVRETGRIVSTVTGLVTILAEESPGAASFAASPAVPRLTDAFSSL